MLPRPRSVLDDIAGCAPVAVPTGAPEFSKEWPHEPLNKEAAMERWMEHMHKLHKAQAGFTYRIGYALAHDGKESLDFSSMRTDLDLINEEVEKAEKMRNRWEKMK